MKIHYRKREGATGGKCAACAMGLPNDSLQKHTHRIATAYGARFGRWPCLRAWYVQVSFGKYRYSWWVTHD